MTEMKMQLASFSHGRAELDAIISWCLQERLHPIGWGQCVAQSIGQLIARVNRLLYIALYDNIAMSMHIMNTQCTVHTCCGHKHKHLLC